jgi:hypothetical protein
VKFHNSIGASDYMANGEGSEQPHFMICAWVDALIGRGETVSDQGSEPSDAQPEAIILTHDREELDPSATLEALRAQVEKLERQVTAWKNRSND